MPVLEKGEVRLPYETWGDAGDWILLINGYTRTRTDFKSMGRFLAEHGWRAIAFDNRGAGKAECPPVFSLDDMAEDVSDLLAHVGAEASHVLGISYGGAIATTFAAAHPEKTKSLVLVSTAIDEGSLCASVETRGPSRDPRRLEADLSRYFSPSFIAGNKLLVQGFMRQMGKIFQELDTSMGARAQRTSMDGLDLTPLLPRVKAPTFILHGSDDHVVKPDSAKALNVGIAGSRLELLPNVGHLLLAEMPKRFYELVDEFCRSVGGK